MKKSNFDVESTEINMENEAIIPEEKSDEETYKDRADEKGKISASRKVDMRKHSEANDKRIAKKSQPKESSWKRSCRLKEEAALKDTSKRNPKKACTNVSDED